MPDTRSFSNLVYDALRYVEEPYPPRAEAGVVVGALSVRASEALDQIVSAHAALLARADAAEAKTQKARERYERSLNDADAFLKRALAAEAEVEQLRSRAERFAGELDAMGCHECAEQARREILAGPVVAPRYDALCARVAELEAKARAVLDAAWAEVKERAERRCPADCISSDLYTACIALRAALTTHAPEAP